MLLNQRGCHASLYPTLSQTQASPPGGDAHFHLHGDTVGQYRLVQRKELLQFLLLYHEAGLS